MTSNFEVKSHDLGELVLGQCLTSDPRDYLQWVVPVARDPLVHWQQHKIHTIVVSLIQGFQHIGQNSGICNIIP